MCASTARRLLAAVAILVSLTALACNTGFESRTLEAPASDDALDDTAIDAPDVTDTTVPPDTAADTAADDTRIDDATDTAIDMTVCDPAVCSEVGEVCHEGTCCQPHTCESLGLCGDALDDACGGVLACGCQIGEQCDEGSCVRVSRLPDTATHACQTDPTGEPEACPLPGEAYHGQDGSYDIRLPAYEVDPVTDTALDLYTGLRWTRTLQGEASTIGEAAAICAALPIGAFRVPTTFELLTLIDYGRDAELVDATAFVDRSGAVLTHQSGAVLTVGLEGGYVGPITTAQPVVLCVEGDMPPRDLVIDTTETATDRSLALSWTRATSASLTWVDALAWCEALTLDGYEDWRMPTQLELHSLVDEFSGADTVFSVSPGVELWSATPDQPYNSMRGTVGDEAVVRSVIAGDPDTSQHDLEDQAPTLCVRNTDL